MERCLYIDANVYLRFYDSSSSQFKKLLLSLEEVTDDIFVTKQVTDEVQRRKLGVFITTLNEYLKKIAFSKITLPEHLETSSNNEIKEWNEKIEKIEETVKNLKQDFKKIADSVIENIYSNTDEVSIILNKIFQECIIPTNEQLISARARKEIGNPPGKNNNTLGDQITWEQILEKANSINEIWIISNDVDYIYSFGDNLYLNPFLVKELKEKKSDISIHCFNTLAEGLRSFNKAKNISSLPPSDQLNKINEEEKQLSENQVFYGTSGSSGYSGYTGPTGPTGYGYSGYGGASGYSGSTGSSGKSGTDMLRKAVEIVAKELEDKDKT